VVFVRLSLTCARTKQAAVEAEATEVDTGCTICWSICPWHVSLSVSVLYLSRSPSIPHACSHPHLAASRCLLRRRLTPSVWAAAAAAVGATVAAAGVGTTAAIAAGTCGSRREAARGGLLGGASLGRARPSLTAGACAAGGPCDAPSPPAAARPLSPPARPPARRGTIRRPRHGGPPPAPLPRAAPLRPLPLRPPRPRPAGRGDGDRRGSGGPDRRDRGGHDDRQRPY
jgi:hypothetical protein